MFRIGFFEYVLRVRLCMYACRSLVEFVGSIRLSSTRRHEFPLPFLDLMIFNRHIMIKSVRIFSPAPFISRLVNYIFAFESQK